MLESMLGDIVEQLLVVAWGAEVFRPASTYKHILSTGVLEELPCLEYATMILVDPKLIRQVDILFPYAKPLKRGEWCLRVDSFRQERHEAQQCAFILSNGVKALQIPNHCGTAARDPITIAYQKIE